MTRWLRMLRATVITGLTFATGIGGITFILGLIGVLFDGEKWVDVARDIGMYSVVAFLLGVLFSIVLALAARGRRFSDLSLPRFAAMGAGAGFIYFCLISLNAWNVWTPMLAFGNFMLLTLLGAGAASTVLLFARRGRGELPAAEEPEALNDGTR